MEQAQAQGQLSSGTIISIIGIIILIIVILSIFIYRRRKKNAEAAPVPQPIASPTIVAEPQVFPEALAQTNDSMTIDKVSEPIEHSQVESAIEEVPAPMDGLTADSVTPAQTSISAPISDNTAANDYGRQYQSETALPTQTEPIATAPSAPSVPDINVANSNVQSPNSQPQTDPNQTNVNS